MDIVKYIRVLGCRLQLLKMMLPNSKVVSDKFEIHQGSPRPVNGPSSDTQDAEADSKFRVTEAASSSAIYCQASESTAMPIPTPSPNASSRLKRRHALSDHRDEGRSHLSEDALNERVCRDASAPDPSLITTPTASAVGSRDVTMRAVAAHDIGGVTPIPCHSMSIRGESSDSMPDLCYSEDGSISPLDDTAAIRGGAAPSELQTPAVRPPPTQPPPWNANRRQPPANMTRSAILGHQAPSVSPLAPQPRLTNVPPLLRSHPLSSSEHTRANQHGTGTHQGNHATGRSSSDSEDAPPALISDDDSSDEGDSLPDLVESSSSSERDSLPDLVESSSYGRSSSGPPSLVADDDDDEISSLPPLMSESSDDEDPFRGQILDQASRRIHVPGINIYF